MFTATLCVTPTPHFEATLFLRHSRTLRAIFTESQAWFCLADLARLIRWMSVPRSSSMRISVARSGWKLMASASGS